MSKPRDKTMMIPFINIKKGNAPNEEFCLKPLSE
jgi:hypothetical protein